MKLSTVFLIAIIATPVSAQQKKAPRYVNAFAGMGSAEFFNEYGRDAELAAERCGFEANRLVEFYNRGSLKRLYDPRWALKLIASSNVPMQVIYWLEVNGVFLENQASFEAFAREPYSFISGRKTLEDAEKSIQFSKSIPMGGWLSDNKVIIISFAIVFCIAWRRRQRNRAPTV